MKAQLFAFVAEEGEVRPRQFMGLPREITDGVDRRQELPRPQVLFIEFEKDGTFLLLRYTGKGDFAGDTWHPALEEAYEQAVFEYGNQVSEWNSIPQDATDSLAYALEQLGK